MLKKICSTFFGLALLLTTANVFANSRASLFLVGEIAVISNLFVNPTLGGVDTLDIENGETNRLVATVDEESNNAAGYRIDLESVNNGNLRHNNGTDQVAYTISYDGGAATTPGPVGTPATGVKTSGALTGLTTDTSNVEITVTAGGTGIPAGAYTDTLIFTMVAL